jgi:hypothetical protein
MNNHERIPWISSHPVDVKRGTFIGEMSRLAMLSSNSSHYLDAIVELKNLYLGRGYPQPLVDTWIKNNMQQRWKNRLEERVEEHATLFTLKSQYNDAWLNVNAHQLLKSITDPWVEWQYAFENNLLGKEGQLPFNRGDFVRILNEWFPDYLMERSPQGNLGLTATWERSPVVKRVQHSDGSNVCLIGLNVAELIGSNTRLLVSRKRNRNLADLTNSWRRSLIYSEILDQDGLRTPL